MRHRAKLSFLLVILTAFFAFGQAYQPTPANVENRVDSLLKQLTLEEKIDLIGGVDDFYIRDNQAHWAAATEDGGRAGWR